MRPLVEAWVDMEEKLGFGPKNSDYALEEQPNDDECGCDEDDYDEEEE